MAIHYSFSHVQEIPLKFWKLMRSNIIYTFYTNCFWIGEAKKQDEILLASLETLFLKLRSRQGVPGPVGRRVVQ